MSWEIVTKAVYEGIKIRSNKWDKGSYIYFNKEYRKFYKQDGMCFNLTSNEIRDYNWEEYVEVPKLKEIKLYLFINKTNAVIRNSDSEYFKDSEIRKLLDKEGNHLYEIYWVEDK